MFWKKTQRQLQTFGVFANLEPPGKLPSGFPDLHASIFSTAPPLRRSARGIKRTSSRSGGPLLALAVKDDPPRTSGSFMSYCTPLRNWHIPFERYFWVQMMFPSSLSVGYVIVPWRVEWTAQNMAIFLFTHWKTSNPFVSGCIYYCW